MWWFIPVIPVRQRVRLESKLETSLSITQILTKTFEVGSPTCWLSLSSTQQELSGSIICFSLFPLLQLYHHLSAPHPDVAFSPTEFFLPSAVDPHHLSRGELLTPTPSSSHPLHPLVPGAGRGERRLSAE